MVDARSSATVPRARTCAVVAVAGLLVIAIGALLASPHTDADVAFMQWINDPPAPLSWLLAATSPFLRPVPLTAIVVALTVWILLAAPNRVTRVEIVRAGVIAFVVAELVAQVTKRVTDEPRPLTVIPGLDQHGYGGEPHGLAYPSAHTAVSVGLVVAMWPWLTRAQRIVGVVVVVSVMLNRLYIGAHWPVDLLGGAAVGVTAAAVAWLVAGRWPLRAPNRRHDSNGRATAQ